MNCLSSKIIVTNSLEGFLYAKLSNKPETEKIVFVDNCRYYDNEFVEFSNYFSFASQFFCKLKPFPNKKEALLARKQEVFDYIKFQLMIEKGLSTISLGKARKEFLPSKDIKWIGLSPFFEENFSKKIFKLAINKLSQDQNFGIWKNGVYIASNTKEYGAFFEGPGCNFNHQALFGFSNLSDMDSDWIEVAETIVQVKQKLSATDRSETNIFSNKKIIEMLLSHDSIK